MQGITIVLVTHENDIAEYTKRIVEFRDGQIIRDHINKKPKEASKEIDSTPAL